MKCTVTYQRGQPFRFRLGMRLGSITLTRKAASCDLCGAPLYAGGLKGSITWRSSSYDAASRQQVVTHGQTKLCLPCVEKYDK